MVYFRESDTLQSNLVPIKDVVSKDSQLLYLQNIQADVICIGQMSLKIKVRNYHRRSVQLLGSRMKLEQLLIIGLRVTKSGHRIDVSSNLIIETKDNLIQHPSLKLTL